MCGRYNLRTNTADFARVFGVDPGFDLPERYNVAPSQTLPIVRDNGDRQAVQARWGLVPFWSKDLKIGNRLINARSETVAEKPAFRAAFRKRRCLVPATGFYEWQKTDTGKQPYHIGLADAGFFAFAGLCDHGDDPVSGIAAGVLVGGCWERPSAAATDFARPPTTVQILNLPGPTAAAPPDESEMGRETAPYA